MGSSRWCRRTQRFWAVDLGSSLHARWEGGRAVELAPKIYVIWTSQPFLEKCTCGPRNLNWCSQCSRFHGAVKHRKTHQLINWFSVGLRPGFRDQHGRLRGPADGPVAGGAVNCLTAGLSNFRCSASGHWGGLTGRSLGESTVRWAPGSQGISVSLWGSSTWRSWNTRLDALAAVCFLLLWITIQVCLDVEGVRFGPFKRFVFARLHDHLVQTWKVLLYRPFHQSKP